MRETEIEFPIYNGPTNTLDGVEMTFGMIIRSNCITREAVVLHHTAPDAIIRTYYI